MQNINLNDIEAIRAAGIKGDKYIWLYDDVNDREAAITNKYGLAWWTRANKDDILRQIVY